MKAFKIFCTITFLASVSFAQDTTYHERLYLVTGEYSPQDNWHGILMFEESENYDSEPGAVKYTPEATIPIKQCFDGSVMLNFGHGMYLHDSLDRMYLSTLFTNQNNYITSNSDTAVGSIAVFENISTLNGAQIPARHIFGDSTQIKQPHGCWLDETRDMLYVANTFGKSILVFENASTADGNISPTRIITHDSLGAPVYIFIDPVVDRMFVTSMSMGTPGLKSQVLIYNKASTLNGSKEPDIRITGNNTRLELLNMTVHNCWFNADNQLLAVGHHTNELLFFDLSSINWNPGSPVKYDLTPRVIRVDDPSLGHDSIDVNLYGFFWDLSTDRMFCSVGVDNPGGGPAKGAPPEAIKMFNNVSDSSISGIVQPDRVIYWSNGGTYYPPQPLWLQKTVKITTDVPESQYHNKIKINPNPFSDYITIDCIKDKNHVMEICINNLLGQGIYYKKLEKNQNSDNINLEHVKSGIYVIKIKDEKTVFTYKVIKR